MVGGHFEKTTGSSKLWSLCSCSNVRLIEGLWGLEGVSRVGGKRTERAGAKGGGGGVARVGVNYGYVTLLKHV